MKKQLLKMTGLLLSVSLLCSCAAQENMSSSLSVPETSSKVESSAEETTSSQETNKAESEENTTKNKETSAPETTTTTSTETETEKISTSETTTKAPETEASTPAPETTPPAPLWTEKEVNKTMYVTVGCYSRKEAIQGAETVSLYNVNDKVKIIAETNTGYCKLENGAFIHKDYLSNNKVVITTTTAATTPKPTETKPIETTTSSTTTPPTEEPTSRLSEIYNYYDFYSVDTSKAKVLNKKNINNYDTFLSVFVNFFNESAIKNTIYFYTPVYDINANSYDFCLSSGELEKLAFLTLLNYDDIDDQTLKSIFKIYSEDELTGIIFNIGEVFYDDLDNKSYYDYSKIVINEEVRNVLIDAHNAYVANDGKKMGELCNKNFNKYNGLVDALLLTYKFCTKNVVGFEFNGTPSELFVNLQENMGIYDRIHS